MATLDGLLANLGQVGVIAGKVAAYLVLAAVAAAAAATLYRYGPSRVKAKWTWITPGSLLFAIGWVILTLGFGFYVSHFAKYNVTYGSLGGVVVLVTWMYLSSFVLLFGAEFNSEVEHQTAKDTTSDEQTSRLATAAPGRPTMSPMALPTRARRRACKKNSPCPTIMGSVDAAQRSAAPPAQSQPPHDGHPYVAARVTNRAAGFAGLQKVGMVSAALSTARPVASAQARAGRGGRSIARDCRWPVAAETQGLSASTIR